MSAMPARQGPPCVPPPPQTRSRVVDKHSERNCVAHALADPVYWEQPVLTVSAHKASVTGSRTRRHPGQCIPGACQRGEGGAGRAGGWEGAEATGPSMRHPRRRKRQGSRRSLQQRRGPSGVSGSRPSRNTPPRFSHCVSGNCAEGRGLPKAGVWLQHRAQGEG